MPTQYFVFSTSHIYLLFRPWYITTGWQYALGFICVFIGALLFEYLKIVQTRLSSWEQRESNRSTLSVQQQQDGEARALLSTVVESERTSAKRNLLLPPSSSSSSSYSTKKHFYAALVLRFARSLLHAIQITLSYFLMVVVMTFNAGLLFAIIGGAAVGYFWFACAKQRCPAPGTIDASLPEQEQLDMEVPSSNSSGVACH